MIFAVSPLSSTFLLAALSIGGPEQWDVSRANMISSHDSNRMSDDVVKKQRKA